MQKTKVGLSTFRDDKVIMHDNALREELQHLILFVV